jgi:hypothetical protein
MESESVDKKDADSDIKGPGSLRSLQKLTSKHKKKASDKNDH